MKIFKDFFEQAWREYLSAQFTIGLIGLPLIIEDGCGKKDYPLADKTPEIRKFEGSYMSHGTTDGLILNVFEGSSMKDNEARRIDFFDYGFDGNLDEVTIMQSKRKDYVTKDKTELSEWQPLYEKMRKRRFGEYDSNKKN